MEGLPNFQPAPSDAPIMQRIMDINTLSVNQSNQKLTPKQMAALLRKEGLGTSNKRIRRLMRFMGLEQRPVQ